MPDWAEPVVRYILEVGLPATLRVSAIAVVGATVIGIVLGTRPHDRSPPSRDPDPGLRRGLPRSADPRDGLHGLLRPPSINPELEFGPLTATAIALILWGSAQVAEATRGAVQSIPREQHEAAAALGFGWVGRHRSVILPQALRRLLPPLVSLLVNIIQNSTLAAVIGGIELLQAGKAQTERLTFYPPAGIGEIHAFEIFAFVALLFFLISFPLTRLAAYLEKAPRLRATTVGGLRGQRESASCCSTTRSEAAAPLDASSWCVGRRMPGRHAHEVARRPLRRCTSAGRPTRHEVPAGGSTHALTVRTAGLCPHPSGGGLRRRVQPGDGDAHRVGRSALRDVRAAARERDRHGRIVRDARPSHRQRRAPGLRAHGKHGSVWSHPVRERLSLQRGLTHGDTSRGWMMTDRLPVCGAAQTHALGWARLGT